MRQLHLLPPIEPVTREVLLDPRRLMSDECEPISDRAGTRYRGLCGAAPLSETNAAGLLVGLAGRET